MATVEMRNIKKSFDTTEVLHGIDLIIEDREFVVLVGPSGCGKSTLLRMIAGLEEITAGNIAIGGKVVNNVRAKNRNIAMVFQNYALYPHMSVYKNIAFSLRIGGMDKREIDQRVKNAAKILDLSDLLKRQPRQLSGGQRQRVAMGRAIVRDPEVFLFDEPLSNLDAKLRVQMRAEIRHLHQRLNATTIYVTHDQLEAMTMADRIVIMNEGKVEQIGPPLELYDCPQNIFVAGFLGSPPMNFLSGAVRDGQIETDSGLLFPYDTKQTLDEGRRVVYGIRPEHIELAAEPGGGVQTKVIVVETTGAGTQVISDTPDGRVIAAFNQRYEFRPGESIGLVPQIDHSHLFDAETGARI